MQMIKESNDADITKLKRLEKSQSITIGIKRDYANNLWSEVSLIGKILNYTTPLLIIFTIIIFITLGVSQGIISLIFTGLYAFLIQKIAATYVRARVLFSDSGYFFKDAYLERKITIRDNSNGKIIAYPIDWREWLNNKG